MARLNFVDAGPRDAQVLILAGGIGTDLHMWDAQLEALSGRFRVVAIDLRGHGQSEVPPAPYTVPELGEDVLELMDNLRLGRAAYCGLSLGGMIGFWLASEAPDRFSHLVVSCTAVRVDPQMWLDRVQQLQSEGIASLVDGTLSRWFTAEFRTSQPDVVASVAEALRRTPAEGFIGCSHAIAELDIEDRLPLITGSTLLIAADQDRTMPRVEADRIAALVRTQGTPASTASVGHAGHLANIEQAGRFTELLSAHVAE